MQNNPEVLICEEGSSLTHQEFKDECEISFIMDQYQRVGMLKHVTNAKEMFGDYTNIPDYQSALNAVIAADAAFAELPANIRARFDNDPGKFLSFAQDSSNLEEMVNLGLADRKVTIEPVVETGKKLNKTDSQESAT